VGPIVEHREPRNLLILKPLAQQNFQMECSQDFLARNSLPRIQQTAIGLARGQEQEREQIALLQGPAEKHQAIALALAIGSSCVEGLSINS
jgi:hypothetical protein